jgi:hypothetical protein
MAMPSSTPKANQSLADLFPSIAAQWHPTKNGDVSPFSVGPASNKRFWWKCDVAEDHEWESTVANRAAMVTGGGCPCCRGYKIVSSNCLATTHPILCREWHSKNDLRPTQVGRGSAKKVWWKCSVEEDHEWKSVISSRATRNSKCPFCLGQRVAYSNCLKNRSPKISAQWHPTKNGSLTPEKITNKSHTRIWWKCEKGSDHVWQATITNRHLAGCPYCKNSKGEEAVAETLRRLGIAFQPQFMFDNCKNKRSLPFDFLVIEPNNGQAGLIEYHGQQHYKAIKYFDGEKGLLETQERDQIKEEFCRKANIPLLIIPYTKFLEIDRVVEEFVVGLPRILHLSTNDTKDGDKHD